jgi:hypothetical protein
MKNYDPIGDLDVVLEKIKRDDAPDALLMAGDMFDFKKTTGVYLRHYEGEGLTITIRRVLDKFGLPIFSIRGNHEKEEVLRGLAQTVGNFKYVNKDWKILNDVAIYFMGTHFEGDFYEPEVVSQIIQHITLNPDVEKKTKILLCHETFSPLPNCLPSQAIEEVKKSFDWILNGHMHFWSDSGYGLKGVVSLPAGLPSRVIWGKYWTEQYYWQHDSKEPKFITRDSPFGYAILDTDRQSIELRQFTPSRKIVEVSIDATSLTLGDVIKHFRAVLDNIRTRKDKDSLIVLPEVHGDASFVTTFLRDVLKDYADLNVEELRINTTAKIITASGKIVTPPLLTPEQVFEELEHELPEISKKLSSELQMDIGLARLKKMLNDIRTNELLDKIPPRTTTRLENLLDVILSLFKELERPETYEDDLKSMIKRVKE